MRLCICISHILLMVVWLKNILVAIYQTIRFHNLELHFV